MLFLWFMETAVGDNCIEDGRFEGIPYEAAPYGATDMVFE